MTEHTEKTCPKCGQRLRFPKNVGGILMSCPSCGKKFHSNFKLGGVREHAGNKSLFTTLFELPHNLISYIGRYFSSK